MSPEQIGLIVTAIVSLVGAFVYVIRENNKTRNEAKRQVIASRARQDKIESDAKQRENEADNRQRKIIDGFAVDFNQKNEDQAARIEKLSGDLQTALVDKSRLEGRIDELIRNQDIDRNKLEALSKRISELEIDNKVKDDMLIKVTKERDDLSKKLSDSKDMISAKILEIQALETKLSAQNGANPPITAEISVISADDVQTTISSVPTPEIEDNNDG